MCRVLKEVESGEGDLQVPEQEDGRHGETNTDKGIVERCSSQVSGQSLHS